MEFKKTKLENNNNSNKKEEVSNMTNNSTKNTIESINVNHAIVFYGNQNSKVDNKVIFTAFINNIMLSDLELITTKDGKEFLAFPKRKTEVNGQEKYYNRVYFKYTKEDLEKIKTAINNYDKEKGVKEFK